MNVVYLINYAGKGGTEKYVRILVEQALKEGNVFLIYNEEGNLCEEMKQLGATTIQLTMRSPFDMKAAKQLAAICKEHNVDVVHAQFARENILALLAKKMLPNLCVVFTSHVIIHNNFMWKLVNFVMTRENDAVIALFKEAKQILIKNKYPAKKIEVVYNGVPYEDSLPKVKNIKEQFVFISLTRFTEEKGTMFLLDSVAKLKEIASRPFVVQLVGDGELLEAAKKYAEKILITDKVQFLGYREDGDALLKEADIFINSSRSEALSFAILEAMAKGLPVIATRVGGNIDIMETGAGLLVDYNDANQMSYMMKKMMDDSELYVECAEKAVVAAQTTFNLETTIINTIKLYKRKDVKK